MNPGDIIAFRATGPHGWEGKGQLHSTHTILTKEGLEVPVYLVTMVPGEAHSNDGEVAGEAQGIVIGEGELA